MPTRQLPVPRVLVSGDFVLDHHIYEGRRQHLGQPVADGVKVVQQLGGAALVSDLLNAVEPGVAHLDAPDLATAASGLSTAHAFWRPYPLDGAKGQFWRVGEVMGFGSAKDVTAPAEQPSGARPGQPAVVVLSDGGIGFRERTTAWPGELSEARWIVLKMSFPVGEGSLWEHLTTAHQDRLVVVVSASDLRKSTARISRGLSWEQAIGDLLAELQPGGALAGLARCRHLIVSFDSEGAVWLDLDSADAAAKSARLTASTRVSLVHDAPVIEGERGHALPGRAFGFQSCMAAAVAWQLSRENPDLAGALESGLAASRDILERGHGPAAEGPAGFPAARLAGTMTHVPYIFSRASFLAGAAREREAWSVLQESLRSTGDAAGLARLVLLRGPIALASLPHLKIGNLLTADRLEMEALRSLGQVVRRYQRHDAGKKPLSLAVFGPPGAGKSFAVRELAGQVVENHAWLEFNLSQFSGPADLIGAFHQIRDKVLQGRMPVAFFDEFDAGTYKWLAPLLAPMQDGQFQAGQLTHPLGKCIFIFAGGTSWTFETFGPPMPEATSPVESPEWREFRLAKGPDFKSRIDAFLNVVGPNSRMAVVPVGQTQAGAQWVGGHQLVPDTGDICRPIRRALMMRNELRCKPEEKLDIDEGLVQALLNAERYTHGARSLGKVLQPLVAARPGALRRSLLLPHGQLAMHVDPDAFVKLCGNARPVLAPGGALTHQLVEAMAPVIHDTWRALGKNEGWLEPEDDHDFAGLSDFLKRSNRAAAERMLANLALVGLTIGEGTATVSEEQWARERIEYALETLAEAEHDGWMAWHLAEGWRLGPKKDRQNQRHHCLVPYIALPTEQKVKDRDSVRHYPRFARLVGLKIATPVGLDRAGRDRVTTRTE